MAKTTYTYDGDGEQASATSPDGNLPGSQRRQLHHRHGLQRRRGNYLVTEAGGTGATVTPRTTSYGYDGDGNQTTITDARGYTTTTIYNADDEAGHGH